MKTIRLFVLCFLLTAKISWSFDLPNDENGVPFDEAIYRSNSHGIDMGIINPEKYSLESFARDEQNVFRQLYREYVSLNGSQSIHYDEWLVMNNFGVLPDTQESLFERKITKRSIADNKSRFVNTVKEGDILITGRGIVGLVGHAAIMASDYWVLEMAGGEGWLDGIPSNNRLISKHAWFDAHESDWTTVYRCPRNSAASEAAVWAYRNYYDSTGTATKTEHITYKITAGI